MTEINKVRGIGPATAEALVKGGFSSAADIASASVEDLAKVPGVKEPRARALIDAARSLLADIPVRNADVASDEDAAGKLAEKKGSGKKKKNPREDSGKSKKNKKGKGDKNKKDKKKRKEKRKKKK